LTLVFEEVSLNAVLNFVRSQYMPKYGTFEIYIRDFIVTSVETRAVKAPSIFIHLPASKQQLDRPRDPIGADGDGAASSSQEEEEDPPPDS
jgi:hypothetical protein